MTDPIGDLLTRIRNGYLASHSEVEVPYSKIKNQLAEIFVSQGYLEKAKSAGGKKKKLVLVLKYLGKKPAVTKIKRISKPGRRIYLKAKEIRPVLSGLGTIILTTPAGLMTGQEARKKKLGGEVICCIW
jgi:small subunit ribosomal protein S8